MNRQHVIERYKSALETYSMLQLRYQPAEDVWSISQVYDHVIVVAHEYLDEVEACATLKQEQQQGKTAFGAQLFEVGGFPPIKIKLPKELNAPPKNDESKDSLMRRLNEVLIRVNQLENEVDEMNPKFKIEHGGFGWLNAREWLDLVDMHFRHHVRQIDEMEQEMGRRNLL